MTMLPPGKYWIGDPCYIVPDELWHEILDVSDYFNKPGVVAGVDVHAFHTAYGDGCYHDNYGNEYGVDAGLIGIVNVDQAKAAGWPIPLHLGHVFESPDDFAIYANNGDMYFQHVHINTED